MNTLMDLSVPVNLPPELWHVLAAVCLTVILIISIAVRARIRNYATCRLCHRNHAQRPPQMSSYDFWWLHCRQDMVLA